MHHSKINTRYCSSGKFNTNQIWEWKVSLVAAHPSRLYFRDTLVPLNFAWLQCSLPLVSFNYRPFANSFRFLQYSRPLRRYQRAIKLQWQSSFKSHLIDIKTKVTYSYKDTSCSWTRMSRRLISNSNSTSFRLVSSLSLNVEANDGRKYPKDTRVR